jgi:hypothetical protein
MRTGAWVRALACRDAWRRALLVGVPVGLLQAAIHQGNAWARGAVDAPVVLKTLMSPLLSFALVWAGAALARGKKEARR